MPLTATPDGLPSRPGKCRRDKARLPRHPCDGADRPFGRDLADGVVIGVDHIDVARGVGNDALRKSEARRGPVKRMQLRTIDNVLRVLRSPARTGPEALAARRGTVIRARERPLRRTASRC